MYTDKSSEWQFFKVVRNDADTRHTHPTEYYEPREGSEWMSVDCSIGKSLWRNYYDRNNTVSEKLNFFLLFCGLLFFLSQFFSSVRSCALGRMKDVMVLNENLVCNQHSREEERKFARRSWLWKANRKTVCTAKCGAPRMAYSWVACAFVYLCIQ